MEKIGLFWGSTTGNQEEAAKFLTDYMVSEGFEVDSYDIKSTDPAKMLDYSQLIIGCPTWNVGELQEDWEKVFEAYKKLDFSGSGTLGGHVICWTAQKAGEFKGGMQ